MLMSVETHQHFLFARGDEQPGWRRGYRQSLKLVDLPDVIEDDHDSAASEGLTQSIFTLAFCAQGRLSPG
jgi:hypothetical protein